MLNPDFRDMLSEFSDAGVEYLLVGAYALAVHGFPRATGDLDLWVRPDSVNARRVLHALVRFGAPVADFTEQDLSTRGTVIQIGVVPGRIDVLTDIEGVEFAVAWKSRLETQIEGITVPVLDRICLLKNKRACGRPKDMIDAAWREEQGE
jgi:hypothetical protein